MFSKKKTECRVCGYRFTPERENIYTAEEPRSMAVMLTKAPTRFSAVDCPICGCQIALAIRVPRVDISDNAERHDADALNIPASPYPDGDKGVLACPNCGSGEYLHNADENENAFCGQCGQAIKWGCEEDGSAHCGSRPYDPENPNARCSAQSKKPEGIAAELADVIIRVLDYCAYAGIDIENVLEVKHEYNKSRPYRHGGKKC